MEIKQLMERHSDCREKQEKAIFASLFIVQNELQTSFDKIDPDVTLKQWLLLVMLKQSGEPLTLTQLGRLMGCSRQNVKKLAAALEKKGYVSVEQNTNDIRASCVVPTEKIIKHFQSRTELYDSMLGLLFREFSDEEVQQLFQAFNKLYGGANSIGAYIKNQTEPRKGK